MSDDEIKYLGQMRSESRGMLFLIAAILGGLVHQKAINREQLIDYLMAAAADLSPDERLSDYGLQLQAIVQILEQTQFPDSDEPMPPIQ
jgi:hypothetical protein